MVPDHLLRPALPADEPFLRALFDAVRGATLAALPEPLRGELLALQYAAMRADYGRRYPGAEHAVVVADGVPAGHLLVHRSADEIRLVDVALVPAARDRGLGTALLRALQAEAAATTRPLRLTVDAHNPALRLYRRLGFSVTDAAPPDLALEWRPA